MTESIVRCVELAKTFGKIVAVDRLNFAVTKGQILSLVGPSGCGKTTILRIMAGFEAPDSGSVELAGKVVVDSKTSTPPEKRRVGMVFQDYALFPHMTIQQNVSYGLHDWDTDARNQRVAEVLQLVQLEGTADRKPFQLSGGEQQRMALARALAPRPLVLLLDEPFSNLDANLRLQVRSEVRTILRETTTTTIFVTHDRDEALFMGDLVAVMSFGRLEQLSTPEEIFEQPKSRFVASTMGIADFLKANVRQGFLMTELGRVEHQYDLPLNADLEIMVRPDDVGFDPSNGKDEIIERVYQGASYLYTIRLPSGQLVRSLQPHTSQHRVGSNVRTFLVGNHNPVPFFEGKPIYPNEDSEQSER